MQPKPCPHSFASSANRLNLMTSRAQLQETYLEPSTGYQSCVSQLCTRLTCTSSHSPARNLVSVCVQAKSAQLQQILRSDSAELPLTLITDHLVRLLLRVASTLPELDAATYAIQVGSCMGLTASRLCHDAGSEHRHKMSSCRCV